MNKKYQVFISSTFRDLVQERQDAIRTVLDLGHIPSGMEIFPAADVDQFEYIKKVINECDYYILIIGGRYGSMDEAGVGFTEKEYDYAVEQRKTVLAFIHGDPTSIAVAKSDIAPALTAKLNAFRKKVSTGRLVQFWTTRESLESKVIKALSKAFADSPGVGWVRGNVPASEELLGQINSLRNSIDALKAENAELKRQNEPRLADIAGLGETYVVGYAYQLWDSRYSVWKSESNGRATLTWAEIFCAVGPSLMRPVAPAAISIQVAKYLKEKKGHDRTNMLLFDTDEATIKIQLLALGLIDSQAAEAAGDAGLSEFLSLTRRGRRQLLELLAVPSSARGDGAAISISGMNSIPGLTATTGTSSASSS